jgi:hypothetical protein
MFVTDSAATTTGMDRTTGWELDELLGAHAEPRQGGNQMKRLVLAVVAALTLLLTAGAAGADPDFGPGNSSEGPNDGGAKCHPPGQTVEEPGCK